jgi:hypothetical protein
VRRILILGILTGGGELGKKAMLIEIELGAGHTLRLSNNRGSTLVSVSRPAVPRLLDTLWVLAILIVVELSPGSGS